MQKHFNTIFYAIFALGLLFSYFYATNQILTGDQTQMLQKGYLGAYTNSWLSYGNEASTVGNVPGSLSAYIIGLPIAFWDSPYAPMVFLVLLHVVSFLLLDSVIKEVYDKNIRLIFLLLYWLNPWFMFENLLYNPSYLFLFAAMHFYSAYNMRNRSSFFFTFIHILSIGMAMQLHYSWPLLAVISTYLFYRGIIKVNIFGALFSFVVIGLSLVPYFQELAVNENIAKNSDKEANDRYIGWGGVHVYPVLKAFLYWLRYASFIFTNKLIMAASFEWVSSVQLIQTLATYLYRAVLFIVGAISIIFALKANIYVYKRIKSSLLRSSTEVDSQKWILLYVVGTLLAIFTSAVLSPIIFSYWHLIMIFAFALFPLLTYLQAEVLNSQNIGKLVLFLVIYFSAINLIASHDSDKYSYKADFEVQTLEYVKTLNIERE
ncbi:MAG: 3-deoxy-D-manno-octulosonic acid transferase [Helicobacteraceae bacterium]|nr:3-deoxy-D-manno-octulosonic acid transferase [Helicobacteraceae bacterium]